MHHPSARRRDPSPVFESPSPKRAWWTGFGDSELAQSPYTVSPTTQLRCSVIFVIIVFVIQTLKCSLVTCHSGLNVFAKDSEKLSYGNNHLVFPSDLRAFTTVREHHFLKVTLELEPTYE